MKTVFGNFIEKTIRNLKQAFVHLNINGKDETMNLEDFKRNLVPEVASYKVYNALLTQNGTDAPKSKVLFNTLGEITFQYDGAGLYQILSNGLFTADKTFYIISPNSDQKVWAITYGGINSLALQCSTGLNDELLNFPIEIRVYN